MVVRFAGGRQRLHQAEPVTDRKDFLQARGPLSQGQRAKIVAGELEEIERNELEMLASDGVALENARQTALKSWMTCPFRRLSATSSASNTEPRGASANGVKDHGNSPGVITGIPHQAGGR
jgi:hypothetical protein